MAETVTTTATASAAPAPTTAPTATAPAPTTTAATPPPPTATTTLSPAPAPAATPSWPDKWREDFAGGDEKLLTRLQRFTSPKDILTSYRALEQRVSAGELKSVSPFPKEGTPEQQNQWRKENGIPEKPEAYDTNLGNGLVIGDEDKPWVNEYLKAAHNANVPQNHVQETLKWYLGYKDAQADQREQADADIARKTVESLRAEWQADYRVNLNGIEALLATAPQGVADKLKNSRMADGTPVMSDPDTLRYLASLFRQINPPTTLVPAGDEATMSRSIDDEIKQIQTLMRTDRKKYNNDEKIQLRYRQLLAARDKIGKRAA